LLDNSEWTNRHRAAFVDYLNKANRDAYRFDQLTLDTVRFIEEVERVSGVPVSLISTNFNWRNVIDRRAW
jgi:adenylosuccinate synthase